MTAKEKAQDLVDKYISLTDGWVYGVKSWEHKKQCALIAVDELIKDNEANEELVNGGLNKQYWQQVKDEITKL
jgi:hypothetical protein